MRKLILTILLASAGVNALPRMFEDEQAAVDAQIEVQAESDYLEQFANPERLHYRSEQAAEPNVNYPNRGLAGGPSPPPASLPIAMPTGPFDPKFWDQKSKKGAIETPLPTPSLPLPPPGGPVPDHVQNPLYQLPQNDQEYQEWLNSILFGVFNADAAPEAAAWQNAGFGPREEIVHTETTGHLPVMTTSPAPDVLSGDTTSFAIADGTLQTVKPTATIISAATDTPLNRRSVVSEPVNSATLDVVQPMVMTLMTEYTKTTYAGSATDIPLVKDESEADIEPEFSEEENAAGNKTILDDNEPLNSRYIPETDTIASETATSEPTWATKAPPFIVPVSSAASGGAPVPT